MSMLIGHDVLGRDLAQLVFSSPLEVIQLLLNCNLLLFDPDLLRPVVVIQKLKLRPLLYILLKLHQLAMVHALNE